MKEFFGFGGFKRPIEGFMSWQHLTLVTSFTVIMIALAVFLGLRNKNRDDKIKNKVLIVSAFLIDGFEIFKIIMLSFVYKNPMLWTQNLPLFLCSIQLITIPIAAFSKGRIKEAALDFVMIFGIVGALLGTYGAANIYNKFPVLSFEPIVSGITHCLSGFCSLYIMFSKMTSMKKENIWITFILLLAFCVIAYIANRIIGYNYMFLMNHENTPYVIFYNLVNGSPILYPIVVVLLFILYITVFYYVYFLITKKKKKE